MEQRLLKKLVVNKFSGAPMKKDLNKTLQKVPAMVLVTAVLDELQDLFS